MSTNCIRCVRNKRTRPDLLCDECGAIEDKKKRKTWRGSTPKKCDVCPAKLDKVFYDTVIFGHWGMFCPQCNKDHGITRGNDKLLGRGIGQKYELKDGVWLKTAG